MNLKIQFSRVFAECDGGQPLFLAADGVYGSLHISAGSDVPSSLDAATAVINLRGMPTANSVND